VISTRFPNAVIFRAAGLIAALLLITSAITRAGDQIALVVGNDTYDKTGLFPVLDNCASDAMLIGDTLTGMGFEVIRTQNASRTVMDEKLSEFEARLKPGCSAAFYFAGHGIEFDGKNYLMGINARLQSRSRLGEESMDAETFATAMLTGGAKASFLFLDCCREAPPTEWLTRGVKKRGLADVKVDGDIIIAYAAKPGQSALDGQGRHSPYATALAHWLPQGLVYHDLFDKVRLEVATATSGKQRTWENGSFLDPFVFPKAPGTALVKLEPPKPIVPSIPAPPPPQKRAAVITATKEAPFVNSLGQEFVPAGMRGVLFCKWDTRVEDYREFENATNREMSGGMFVMKVKQNDKGGYWTSWELDKAASWSNPGFQQSDAHPVVGVSLEDGRAFCNWLTEKERQSGSLPVGAAYRLPTDEEWSAAVGSRKYPWGDSWPPHGKVGNYADASYEGSMPGKWWTVVPGLEDGWAQTSPAGSFAANRYGLYDMGGNVWQWCDTEYKASMNSAEAIKKYPALKEEKASDGTPYRVLRGASWNGIDKILLRSSYRYYNPPTSRSDSFGIRCVLVVSGG
jgi:formylglycine-generating enzyme required for sulfatase activity